MAPPRHELQDPWLRTRPSFISIVRATAAASRLCVSS